MYTPNIAVGKPSNEDNYDRYDIDGILVYVSKSVKLKGERIIVGLSKFLGFQKLYVKGVNTIEAVND